MTSSKALKELDRARYLHPFTNYKQYAKKAATSILEPMAFFFMTLMATSYSMGCLDYGAPILATASQKLFRL